MIILCPYCVTQQGVRNQGSVYFDPHTIDCVNNGSLKEYCPMGGKTFGVTDIFKKCPECQQQVSILQKANGEIIMEGHHYSWATRDGKRVKVAPKSTDGFFSRVWCNSHVQETPIYISEQISIPSSALSEVLQLN